MKLTDNKKNLKLTEIKVNKLTQLAAQNQQMKDYLHHIEEINFKLKNYVEKINSSKIYQLWQKTEKLIKKPIKLFHQIQMESEFTGWNKNKSANKYNVLVFGVIKYDFRFQRPQQLSVEMAKKGHRVFYIEPDFLPQDQNEQPRVVKIRPNLYKVNLRASGRQTTRSFVYYGEISMEDRKVLVKSIKQLIKTAHISNAVIKVDNPSWTFIVGKLNLPIIYDCIDDHGAVETNPENILQAEKSIVKQSSIVIAVSKKIADKISKYKTDNITIIGNAGEYEHFNKVAIGKLPIPKDLKSIKPPILGYCGALAEWFDANLLETVAITFPSCSIVIIGNPDNPKVVELTQKYKNIYLLGEKNYRVIPQYYKRFNVCLIPFIISHEVTRTLNPVKVYEYLATGKPIVSTYIPDLRQYGDAVYLSNNPEEFCQNIKKALTEKNISLSLKRQQFSKNNTWEKRTESLEQIIKKILI